MLATGQSATPFTDACRTSESGPTLPTWALQQVVSYLGYTGRDANVVAEAAFDPNPKSTHVRSHVGYQGPKRK